MAEQKSVNDGIANTQDAEQVLRGIQPKHQIAYKIYKFCKIYMILGLVFTGLFIALKFVSIFDMFTKYSFYNILILLSGASGFIVLAFGLLVKTLFLRKAPFDDWVFDIAEKRLGTSIIFYDSKHIYINYDRSGKEVDKKEFITEMSDKSIHYTYYYVKTFIDSGVIMVECKKRQPIPERASFTPNDDKFWNIVPMGLTINPATMSVSAIGWYLNDQNKNPEMYETIPSTSILINTIKSAYTAMCAKKYYLNCWKTLKPTIHNVSMKYN